MKKLASILLILLFTRCNKEEVKQQENSIYGTWELIAVYSNIGDGKNNWNSIENGYTFSINSSNSFESNKYDKCSSGTIKITHTATANILTFMFNCDNFYPCSEDSNVCQEYFSFDKNKNLILSDSYQNCDEGCLISKFKRIE